MPTSGGIITAPISTDDVCNTLGVSNHDIGYLCSNAHGKLNVWSKKKPVRYDDWTTPDEATMRSLGWGFYIPDASEYASSSSQDPIWQYNAPNNYYRLTDWEGYNHNVESSLGTVSIVPQTINPNNIFSLCIDFPSGLDGGKLTFFDFFETLYFIFYRKGYSGSYIRFTLTRSDVLSGYQIRKQINGSELKNISGFSAGNTVQAHLLGSRTGTMLMSCRLTSGTTTVWDCPTKAPSTPLSVSWAIKYTTFTRNRLMYRVGGIRFTASCTGSGSKTFNLKMKVEYEGGGVIDEYNVGSKTITATTTVPFPNQYVDVDDEALSFGAKLVLYDNSNILAERRITSQVD